MLLLRSPSQDELLHWEDDKLCNADQAATHGQAQETADVGWRKEKDEGIEADIKRVFNIVCLTHKR